MNEKAYRTGTHRALLPEVTLERVRPLLALHGITRLADVTGLDCLGIPTYCAIRPAATTLQVSNGKGARRVDAQVSALMEGLELACAEGPPNQALLLASPGELVARGEGFCIDLPAHARPESPPVGRLEWARGVDLMTGDPSWLPAATAWRRERQTVPYDWSGLASGNTLVEATLHALYEVIERHLLSSFVVDRRVDVSSADVLDASAIADDAVSDLSARIHTAGVKLVLLRAHSTVMHAFMAVLLDPEPLGGASAVNVGYGAHLSPSVAASRAITEAAQSRLTFIHGSREDLSVENYESGPVHARLYRFFDRLDPTAAWETLADLSHADLEADLSRVLQTMPGLGLPRAHGIDMSHAASPIFVVKVVVPEALSTIPC